MQRRFDRRQTLNALMASTAVGTAGLLGACAGGTGVLGPTGSLPSADGAEAGPRPARQSETVKVALLVPTGGSPQVAAIGKALQQAAEMAMFERPSAGLQLIVKDDKGTPEGAKAAADEAIKAGAEIILGPLFGRSVQAVAPVAKAANVPAIGFSNDTTVAGPGVYLIGFLQETEVDRIVGHAVRNDRRMFAALLPDDAGSKMLGLAFRVAVERGGGRVALVETYQIDEAGILDPSRKLREALKASEGGGDIDAMFVPGGADVLPQLSFLIGQAKIDTQKVKLLGSSGWDYPGISREARLAGSWFAAPDPRGWVDFSTKFSKTYGSMPPRLASLAFDAVDVASNFAGQPKGQRYVAANLTRVSGFVGVDGPFRLLPNGRNERALAVLEVQKSGPVVIDGAAALLAGGPMSAARSSSGLQ